MKLKEFELWALQLSTEESRVLSSFSRCVYAHFERHFQPINTDGVYRIILKLCEQDSRIGTVEISSSVLKYYKSFNFELFEKSDEREKKVILLDALYRSLLELADLYSWNKENFKVAYEKVRNEDYVNHYVHQEKWNRSKSMQARVFCEHEAEVFICSLVIVNKLGELISKKTLFKEKPEEFYFNGRLGSIKWINNTTLAHLSKDKHELARFDFGDLMVY